MAKNILAWSEAAKQFYREIGKKPNGKAIRFYLGDDEKKATANVLRLEALWDGVGRTGGEAAPEGDAEDQADRDPFGGKVVARETLHDALDAYKEWIERTFVDIEGRTTQTGKKQGERAARIKRYAKDMPLSDL